jgi:hypothetical protein
MVDELTLNNSFIILKKEAILSKVTALKPSGKHLPSLPQPKARRPFTGSYGTKSNKNLTFHEVMNRFIENVTCKTVVH